ncbi:MAG: acyl-CoA thioesterase [Caldilineaceae bacterium]
MTEHPADSTSRLSCEIELAPAFHDLDPMNIVWHGHYVKYLELARCALLQQIGYDYPQMQESGYLWPIVDMRLKYVRPATYAQKLKVRANIVEWECRLKIDYEIHDAQSGERLTRASTVQVAVDARTRELLYVCPKVLWEKLGVSP